MTTLNKNGVSTTRALGTENFETFAHPFVKNCNLIQYDYRHTNGQLFTCVGGSLKQCRERRNAWLHINETGEFFKVPSK